jgi:hypothetical protein
MLVTMKPTPGTVFNRRRMGGLSVDEERWREYDFEYEAIGLSPF